MKEGDVLQRPETAQRFRTLQVTPPTIAGQEARGRMPGNDPTVAIYNCPLCSSEQTVSITAAALASHQRGNHAGRGREVEELLGGYVGRFRVCERCNDLYANARTHERLCAGTASAARPQPSLEIPPGVEPPRGPRSVCMDRVQGHQAGAGPGERQTGGTRGEQGARQAGTGPTAPEAASPLLNWGLDRVGPALDRLDAATLTCLPFSTSKVIRQSHRRLFAVRFRHAVRLLLQAHGQCRLSAGRQDEHLRLNVERAVKLLHVTPALLQSPAD